MKAVRNRDGEKAKFFYSLYKRCKFLDEYSNRMERFFSSAESVEDLLKLAIAASEPIQTFSDAQLGLEALFRNREGLSQELVSAIGDMISLIKKEQNSFIIGISNSKGQMLEIIDELAKKLLTEQDIQDLLKKYLGSRNKDYLDRFSEGREALKRLTTLLIGDLSVAAKKIQPAFVATAADVQLNSAVFSQIRHGKDSSSYVSAFRILVLVEAEMHDRVGTFFTAIPPQFGNYADAVTSAKQLGHDCMETFRNLDFVEN